MHSMSLPPGLGARLTIRTTPNAPKSHHWAVAVFPAGERTTSVPSLSYRSDPANLDLSREIEIPAQAADCRVEVSSRSESVQGETEDRLTVRVDAPDTLVIGVTAAGSAVSDLDDLLLSFNFRRTADQRGASELAAACSPKRYDELLAALEVNRRHRDDVLVRRMRYLRDVPKSSF